MWLEWGFKGVINTNMTDEIRAVSIGLEDSGPSSAPLPRSMRDKLPQTCPLCQAGTLLVTTKHGHHGMCKSFPECQWHQPAVPRSQTFPIHEEEPKVEDNPLPWTPDGSPSDGVMASPAAAAGPKARQATFQEDITQAVQDSLGMQLQAQMQAGMTQMAQMSNAQIAQGQMQMAQSRAQVMEQVQLMASTNTVNPSSIAVPAISPGISPLGRKMRSAPELEEHRLPEAVAPTAAPITQAPATSSGQNPYVTGRPPWNPQGLSMVPGIAQPSVAGQLAQEAWVPSVVLKDAQQQDAHKYQSELQEMRHVQEELETVSNTSGNL